MAECTCDATQIVLLPCSGGSNVGQLANAAGVQLTREGKGRMYCLAGLGGDLSGFIASTQGAGLRVAIDGCAMGCAQATLRRHGIEPELVVVATELGIERSKDFDLPAEQIETVRRAAEEGIARAVEAAGQRPEA